MIKKLRALIIVCVILLNIIFSLMYQKTSAAILTPTDEQKIEYRATTVKKVNSQYQLTVEIWLHQLTFKGFALRVKFDTSQLTPADAANNPIKLSDYFATMPANLTLVNGFENFMAVDSWSDEADDENGILDLTYTVLGVDERTGTNEFLDTTNPNDTFINVPSDVQIGYMTFTLDEKKVSDTAIGIKTDSLSPMTGVKLIIDGNDEYDAKKLFKFVVVPQQGTIKGSVDTTAQTKNTTKKHQATIRVFAEMDIENLLTTWKGWNWEGLINEFNKKKTDTFHDEIDSNLKEIAKVDTNDDGSYSIDIDPGTYFIIIDKVGYLDIMFYNVKVDPMGVIDLTKKVLTPGDTNKDGQVQLKDKTLMAQKYGAKVVEGVTDKLDFNNDNKINVTDKTMIAQNYGKLRELINMTNLTVAP